MTATTSHQTAGEREGHPFEYACVWLDCPRCGTHCPYVNIGRGHWGYCQGCRATWMFGSNLFSHWRAETQDEQRARYDELGLNEYEHVENDSHPGTRRAYEASEYASPDFMGGEASIEDPWPPTPSLAALRAVPDL